MSATKSTAKKAPKKKSASDTQKTKQTPTFKAIDSRAKATESAKEWLNILQTKIKSFAEAEEGLVAAVKDMVEEKGLNASEVKNSLDQFMGRLKANELWEQVRGSGTVVTLSDYRNELEQQVENIVTRVLSAFQIAKLSDVESVSKQFKSLNRKVNEMNQRLKTLETE
ncbi:MAG: hypothetical protein VYA34_09640 [Myxococcota bacterium]|nr:hypothetical protein [Myxococcota bacterium]